MRRPLIGITSSHKPDFTGDLLNKPYTQAVYQAGGLPVILPILPADEKIEQYLDQIDGLLVSGGWDVDPLCYGENPHQRLGELDPQRDRFEVLLVQKALERDLPILGICRGCQVLNTATGGTLYQDLPSQLPGVMKHGQLGPRWNGTHGVQLEPGTLLHQIVGKEEMLTNSLHHQSIKEVGAGLQVAARTADGVVEAIEKPDARFVLALQWHPEEMWREEDHLKLFQAFIQACSVD